MKLSSGQLFTIELIKSKTVNKWPDEFEFAYMFDGEELDQDNPIFFCQGMPDRINRGFYCKNGETVVMPNSRPHPDYANSLVSRDEFMFAIENNI